MGNMIITVSRQYGSGGKTIAAMLAQKLGINCYSREILKMASEDSGINERLFGMSDEKLRHAGWLKTLSHTYTGELLPPEDKGFTSDDNLFNYQAKTIKELAEKESCIIVGRCANYILKDNPNVLSVFVHADETHMTFMGFEGKPAGYFIMFCICAVAYLVGWVIMKALVPKYKPIVLD